MDETSAMKICIQGDKYLFGYGVTRSYDTAFKRYVVSFLGRWWGDDDR